MLVGERSAGAGLQIPLELYGAVIVNEPDVGCQCPRFVLGGMRRMPDIVGAQALLQVGCDADVALAGS